MKINFGIHDGKRVDVLFDKHLRYCKWMLVEGIGEEYHALIEHYRTVSNYVNQAEFTETIHGQPDEARNILKKMERYMDRVNNHDMTPKQAKKLAALRKRL